MKYFLIAGEASGDLHASKLIEQLRLRNPEAKFAFLGGDLMAKAAGMEPVVHYRDMAFMGFWQVIKHLPQIRRNFKAARQAIAQFKPDRLILIDYPSFNLKMAKYARKLGIPVAYYIPPKVWAWKEYRVKTIRKLVDTVLAIFPFEVDFYARHGMKVDYVGNPSVEEIDARLAQAPSRQDFLKANRLPDKPLLAILPGSRISELKCNLPLMAEASRRFPQYRAVIAGAPGVDMDTYRKILGYDGSNPYIEIPIIFDQTFDLLAHAHAAVVTSGTATLEAALSRVPQVAVYRNNGKRLFRKLKEWFLKVKFVTLPNIIVDHEIIPELLFDQANVETVSEQLALITPDREPRRKQLEGYAQMRQRLGTKLAAPTAAAILDAK